MATTTKTGGLQIDVNGSLSDALSQLIQAFNETNAYTPKTAEQIRSQAEGQYQSYYDQLRLAAQQAQEQQDLALQQQRAGLQYTYDKQREANRRAYEQAYSEADRHALSRGMQRSSYNAQILANLMRQGAEADQDIWDQQSAAEGNVDAQRAQLAMQLATQLQQYDANQAADVMARINELEDQEYDRGQSNTQYRNNLYAQIFEYMQNMNNMEYQRARDLIADEQWQKQFDESVRQFNATHKTSSSSSSRRGSSSKGGSQNNVEIEAGSGIPLSYDSFVNGLNGTSTQSNANKIYGNTITTKTVKDSRAEALATPTTQTPASTIEQQRKKGIPLGMR